MTGDDHAPPRSVAVVCPAGLNNWLRRNPDASYYDRLVAQSLADELSLLLRDGG